MRSSLALLIALSTAATVLGAPEAEVPGIESVIPPFRDADRADYPDADAVILLWEQEYRLLESGEVRRRDHRVVKLFDARVNREFADPRIDFEEGRDEVIVHEARTILPDGTVLPVPGYSRNIAAPNDVAGWPEYAAWRQKIVSFSGIRPGAIVELDYEVVTEPGTRPWLTADLRIAQRHPVLERRISVTAPGGMGIPHRIDGPFAGELFQSEGEGTKTFRWRFHDLPAVPDEPQALPWRAISGRLCFSLPGGALEWVTDRLSGANSAVKIDQQILELGKKTIGADPDPLEAAKKVSRLLKETFTVVRSPKARRSLACRTAGRVLQSGYGNEYEVAALAAALLKSGGPTTSPAIAVDADAWNPMAPTDAAFRGVLLRLEWAGSTIWIDPLEGPIRVPGTAAARLVLDVDREGKLRSERIGRRGEEVESLLVARGALTLGPSGKLKGTLTLDATGGFFDPKDLGTTDARKAWLTKIAGGLVTGLEVKGHTVHTLSDDRFKATVTVEGAKPFLSHGDRRVLRLGDGPLFLQSFPLPPRDSERKGVVLLPGMFRESVHLVINLPEGWTAATPPGQEVQASWGHLHQRLSCTRSVVRLDRVVRMRTDRLPPEMFPGLRSVVNDLRTSAANSVVVGP